MSDLKTDKNSVVCSTCKKRVAESAAIVHDGTGPALFFCSENCIDDYMENQAGLYFEADQDPDEDQDDDDASEEIEEIASADVELDVEDEDENPDDDDDEDEAQDS
jgi:YHS domain-containing protein